MNDSDDFSSRNYSYRIICTAVAMHSFGLLKRRRKEPTDIAQKKGIVTDGNGTFYGSACFE